VRALCSRGGWSAQRPHHDSPVSSGVATLLLLRQYANLLFRSFLYRSLCNAFISLTRLPFVALPVFSPQSSLSAPSVTAADHSLATPRGLHFPFSPDSPPIPLSSVHRNVCASTQRRTSITPPTSTSVLPLETSLGITHSMPLV